MVAVVVVVAVDPADIVAVVEAFHAAVVVYDLARCHAAADVVVMVLTAEGLARLDTCRRQTEFVPVEAAGLGDSRSAAILRKNARHHLDAAGDSCARYSSWHRMTDGEQALHDMRALFALASVPRDCLLAI